MVPRLSRVDAGRHVPLLSREKKVQIKRKLKICHLTPWSFSQRTANKCTEFCVFCSLHQLVAVLCTSFCRFVTSPFVLLRTIFGVKDFEARVPYFSEFFCNALSNVSHTEAQLKGTNFFAINFNFYLGYISIQEKSCKFKVFIYFLIT